MRSRGGVYDGDLRRLLCSLNAYDCYQYSCSCGLQEHLGPWHKPLVLKRELLLALVNLTGCLDVLEAMTTNTRQAERVHMAMTST